MKNQSLSGTFLYKYWKKSDFKTIFAVEIKNMNRGLLQIGLIADGGETGRCDFNSHENCLIGISGCLILLVDSGFAIVWVGAKRRVLRRGMMALLFYDDIFWVERTSRNFQCRYAALAYDNVQEPIYKLISPMFWDSLSENPLLLLSREQQALMDVWYSQMAWICKEAMGMYANDMLRNSLHNLFMAIDGEMMRDIYVERKDIGRNRILVINFLKLLAQHCRYTREVSFYAERLCVTATYLYKLTHKRLNLSPKQLIDQQAICEIKTLLSSTDMSVKEIANTMHFEDVPYMCRYFRRHTGMSPTEYRDGVGKM